MDLIPILLIIIQKGTEQCAGVVSDFPYQKKAMIFNIIVRNEKFGFNCVASYPSKNPFQPIGLEIQRLAKVQKVPPVHRPLYTVKKKNC